jgi:hypothetical protein
MSLDSSALDVYRNRDFTATSNLNCIQTNGSISRNFKKGGKRLLTKVDAGSGWFHMQPTPMTTQLAADIAVVRNRQYLNPNRFYKSSDLSKSKNPVIQVGTVIEGPTEYFASRLTKKERRTNIMDEFMKDSFGKGKYVQEKYTKMQRENTERVKFRQSKGRKKMKHSK